MKKIISHVVMEFYKLTNRRKMIFGLLFCFTFVLLVGTLGCDPPSKTYVRKKEKCLIGKPEDYYFPVQMAKGSSFLIFRDDDGWRAIDARCTFDSCDLSFNGKILKCPCCRSVFNLKGGILSPPAKESLKFWKMDLEDDSLVVYAGELVPPTYHFTTPELQLRMAKIKERVDKEGLSAIVNVDIDLIQPGKRADNAKSVLEEDPEIKKILGAKGR